MSKYNNKKHRISNTYESIKQLPTVYRRKTKKISSITVFDI